MGKPISIGQSHNLVSILVNNVDWSRIDGEIAQRIINDPRRAGVEFTRFIQNGARVHIVGNHVINCSADPFIPEDLSPEGLSVEEHRRAGDFVWDPKKVLLYLSKIQKKGKVIEGNKLRKELSEKPVLNANVLDYLLAHPELIPEEWKRKQVFFWGTIYRTSAGHLFVRHLEYDGERWSWGCGWLGGTWSDGVAAISVDA